MIYDEEYNDDCLSPMMQEVANDLDGEDANKEIEFNQDVIAATGGTMQIGFGGVRDEQEEWLAEDEAEALIAATVAAAA